MFREIDSDQDYTYTMEFLLTQEAGLQDYRVSYGACGGVHSEGVASQWGKRRLQADPVGPKNEAGGECSVITTL